MATAMVRGTGLALSIGLLALVMSMPTRPGCVVPSMAEVEGLRGSGSGCYYLPIESATACSGVTCAGPTGTRVLDYADNGENGGNLKKVDWQCPNQTNPECTYTRAFGACGGQG